VVYISTFAIISMAVSEWYSASSFIFSVERKIFSCSCCYLLTEEYFYWLFMMFKSQLCADEY
jgi:hypothetical protein